MSKRYTKHEKAQILTAFNQRNESAETFARHQGVSLGSLYRWQQEGTSGFCEVYASVEGAESCQLRLVTGEASVHFDKLPSSDYIVSLLQGLRRC